jgi:hypothetical protein
MSTFQVIILQYARVTIDAGDRDAESLSDEDWDNLKKMALSYYDSAASNVIFDEPTVENIEEGEP